ncbi:MAG: TonB-dependent receptor [Proteobacteria bacterium]|nr:TonB-dependent receptor [Pseudomonadota bacterium]MCP4916803.1 TonB-dependent receptor [Pseudomonadota bacterium]
MLLLPLLAPIHAQAPATLSGVLVDRESAEPIEGAIVTLTLDGLEVGTGVSDVTGGFQIRTQAGVLDITVVHDDYAILSDREEVRPGDEVTVKLRMRQPESMTIVIVDEAVGAEVHKTVLSVDELKSVPGTFGDPVRALQTLPGVARPNIAEGALVVRGAEGLNTGYYVDGMPVPYMFHTMVGRSVITSGFIDQVEFFPGGMPSRYGEVTQAAVNVVTDAKPVQSTHATIQLDILDGSLSLEHELTDDLVMRASGRYSWMHALIWSAATVSVLRNGGESYESGYFSPKYADMFADVRWQATDADTLSFMVLGSRDRLVLRQPRYDLDGDGEPDPPDWEGQDLPYDPEEWIDKQFIRARLKWDHEGDVRSHSTWVALGPEKNQNLLGAWFLSREGPYRGRTEGFSTIVRRDETWKLQGENRVVYGGQLTLRPVVAYDFQDIYEDPEAEIPETRDDQAVGSVWVEPQIRTDNWYVAPGIRGTAYAWNGDTSLQAEPRISVRRDIGNDWYGKAAIGRYSQMPPVERYAQGIGNPELPIMTAWQASIGAEGPLPRGLSVDASIYGSVMNDLIVRNLVSEIYTEDDVAYTELRPEFLQVQGYAAGVEGLIRMQPTGSRFWGWVSFTAGRAIRVDKGLGTFSGDYDQPLSLTVLGAYDLPRDFELSGRVQFTSGQPHTPLYGVYVPDDSWFTEYRGEINSERYPYFFRIDVRAQKTWEGRRADWVFYLDVYNVTWRKNAFLATYDYDYSELVPLAHLPLLPTLGVEAHF